MTDKRRHPRRPHHAFAWCTVSMSGAVAVPPRQLRTRLLNLGPGGLSLQAALPLGAEVRLEFEGIVLDTVVSWTRSGQLSRSGVKLHAVLAGREAFEALAGGHADEAPESASSSGIHARAAMVPAAPVSAKTTAR